MTIRIAALLCIASCLACSRGGAGAEPIPHPDLAQATDDLRGRIETAREALDAGGDGAHGRLGMLYDAYGFHDAAAACYRNAGALDPGAARWPYYLGHLLRARGAAEDARDRFRRVLELEPDYVPARIVLGRLTLAAGNRDGAAEQFERAAAVDERHAAALAGLGAVAAARGDHAEAVRHYEAARQLAPGATSLNYPLGLAYRGLGQDERARELLGRRGEIPVPLVDPYLGEMRALRTGMLAHHTRGTALAAEGRDAEALVEFRRAVEADPQEPSAHLNVGHAEARLGNLDAARAAFEEALRLDPEYAAAHYNLGTVLSRTARDEDAVRHYEHATLIQPGLIAARMNLGHALRRLGRFERALDAYNAAIAGAPTRADARRLEGLVLIRLHRWVEARARLELALTLLPDDLELRNVLVRLLATCPDRAVHDPVRAASLAGGLAATTPTLDHAATLAMVAAANGDFAAAVRIQRQVLASRGDAPSVVVEELRRNLSLFESNRPCPRPWRDDDPTLQPTQASRAP
ncbi:MAG: tetratricopeptide repeat protein [bacterium]|nr:tetratricopeptide repeat protein [bacterium]